MSITAGKSDRRLLIVDDEPDLLHSLKEALTHPRVDIAFATNGLEAVARAQTYMPHAMILDVRMPAMDGFEVFRFLRRDPVLRHVRVIMASGLAETGALAIAQDMGAYAWIRKPFDKETLRARVLGALEIEEPGVEVPRGPAPLVRAPVAAERPASPAWSFPETPTQRAGFPEGTAASLRRMTPAPELLLLIAPQQESVALQRRFEDVANVRLIRAVDLDEAGRLGRSPLVRAVVIAPGAEGGEALSDVVGALRGRGVQVPIVHIADGPSPLPEVATLTPHFRPEQLRAWLETITRAVRRAAPGLERSSSGPRAMYVGF